MDTLANVGTVLATPQFIIAIIIGLSLIAGGIYLIMSQAPAVPSMIPGFPSPTESENSGRRIGGGMMFAVGIVTIFAGWIKRKLIRSNPGIAAVAGAFDIAEGLKRIL